MNKWNRMMVLILILIFLAGVAGGVGYEVGRELGSVTAADIVENLDK